MTTVMKKQDVLNLNGKNMSNKKFDLSDYLKKDESSEIIYKPSLYVNMPSCFQKVVGVPGIELGHVTFCYGLSDSGKTEILLNIAKQAVEQDILPILVITENKLKKERLEEKGLIHGENCILEERFDNLEDVYNFVSMKVEDAKNNKLKMNTLILWDSVAGTHSKEAFEVDKDGRITKKFDNQKDANVIGYYNSIIAKRVASTREITCDYSVGLFMVTQAYKPRPEFPGEITDITPNGGEKIWYPCTVGIQIKEGKRHKVTIDEQNYNVGLTCKIKTKKNHMNGIYTEGEILFFENEMLENNDKNIKQMKDKFKETFNIQEE